MAVAICAQCQYPPISLSIRCYRSMASYLERQINAFLWLSLIAVTSFLLRRLALIFSLWLKARPIPGPPCPTFYGHGRLFSTSTLTDILYSMHKRYGGVVKIWLSPTQLLVSIEDLDLIGEVLLKAEDKLPLTGRAFRLAFGKSNLFISSFDKVEHQRKSLELRLGGALLERAISIPENILVRVVENAQNARTSGYVDSKTISLHLAYTILGAAIFGDTFLDWPKATLFEELLIKISKDACFWASYSVTPFWKRGFWRYQESCAKLKCLTQELIKECGQNHKSGFLWEFNGHDNMEYEPCGEIISLMLHGSLTMAALIANILTRLVTHAGIQTKIHSEIVMTQTMGRRPDGQNFDMAPNLLAVVYESARLLPAGPLLQRCSLRHDLRLKDGTIIPAGAIIVVPLLLVQIDVSNWGTDALKFNPCRFISSTDRSCVSDQKDTLTGHPSSLMKDPNELKAFLPFGSSTRACIGQKLAVAGISSLLAALIKHYEVSSPQPGSESSQRPEENDRILQLLQSQQIVFSKRND